MNKWLRRRKNRYAAPSLLRAPSCLLLAILVAGPGPMGLFDRSLAQEETFDHTDIAVDPSIWVLDFDVTKVRSITLLEGPFKGKVFWYMLYTVHNPSAEDRDTYISVTAKSDRKKTYSDFAIASVERAVERKVGRPLWGRTDHFEAQKDRDPKESRYHYTTIKAKERRQCVAIFNPLDAGANEITILVRGLSNDFHLKTAEDGSRVIEERVFEVKYERPEDEYEINLDLFVFRKKHWVKRLTPLLIPGPDGSGE